MCDSKAWTRAASKCAIKRVTNPNAVFSHSFSERNFIEKEYEQVFLLFICKNEAVQMNRIELNSELV